MKRRTWSGSDTRSVALAAFAKRIPGLLSVALDDEIYRHMGATISEAVLQAGINYDTVVKPRIERLRARHPEAATTTAFFDLMKRVDPSELLDFRGRKPLLVLRLTELLRTSGVETESDLRSWVDSTEHESQLLELTGVGAKTVDYLRMLCGVRTCAIDVHVLRFLNAAGIRVTGYTDAKAVVSRAAEALETDPATFDRCIWEYMKNRN